MEETKKEKVKKNNVLVILSITILFIAFILIAWGVGKGYTKNFDYAIYNIVNILECGFMTSLFKVISFLCDVIFMIILCLVLLVVIKNKGYPITLSLNILGVSGLNLATKYIFSRERPIGINLVEETGYSFPSGHAMASLAFYGYVIYLVYKNIQNKWIKLVSISILSLAILLIGTSRIYLGVHFASDVLGGYILALIYLILFIKFVKVKTR